MDFKCGGANHKQGALYIKTSAWLCVQKTGKTKALLSLKRGAMLFCAVLPLYLQLYIEPFSAHKADKENYPSETQLAAHGYPHSFKPHYPYKKDR